MLKYSVYMNIFEKFRWTTPPVDSISSSLFIVLPHRVGHPVFIPAITSHLKYIVCFSLSIIPPLIVFFFSARDYWLTSLRTRGA